MPVGKFKNKIHWLNKNYFLCMQGYLLMTDNFFYQFSQVTQKTGLLRLFVESSSDQGPLVGIESFEDLLGEPTKETLVVSMIISYIELG